jgi:hypothetical protein
MPCFHYYLLYCLFVYSSVLKTHKFLFININKIQKCVIKLNHNVSYMKHYVRRYNRLACTFMIANQFDESEFIVSVINTICACVNEIIVFFLLGIIFANRQMASVPHLVMCEKEHSHQRLYNGTLMFIRHRILFHGYVYVTLSACCY